MRERGETGGIREPMLVPSTPSSVGVTAHASLDGYPGRGPNCVWHLDSRRPGFCYGHCGGVVNR